MKIQEKKEVNLFRKVKVKKSLILKVRILNAFTLAQLRAGDVFEFSKCDVFCFCDE